MYRFPAKHCAEVLGETLEYVSAGVGPATVVLVNGAGGPIEGWYKVFGPLAGFCRVFAYNRPGIGGSGKPQTAQTGSHLVASLRGLLQAAGLAPPYLLVGHSLGGLIVNLYARLHPAEVAAVLLLDATAPADVECQPRFETGLQRALRRVLSWLPQDARAEVCHVGTTVAELQAAPDFPAIPLAVLSGNRPAMAWATPAEALAARAQHQRELAALSPLGVHLIAERSGHFPQLSEPQRVVDTIHTLIAAG